MPRWCSFVVTLAVAGLTAAAPGLRPGAVSGQTADQPVFSARSELVVLHVMVKDRRGGYVTDLMSSAFRVMEDGQPQRIEFFGLQDAPVTVGLIVDSSGSMSAIRDRVIAAAVTFAETSNAEDDIFALAFNDDVTSALPPDAPFTGDPETLRKALASAIVTVGRTALYDAVTQGLSYVAKGTHATKVLVVVSDGGDNASTKTFERLLRDVQASNTLIYTVGLRDPLARDTNPKRLRQLADASGGEAFFPDDTEEIAEALHDIAKDVRNLYTVGYVPTNTARDGRFRRVRVMVTTPDRRRLVVHARQGYVVEEH